MKDITLEELKKDFENLLQNYWYAIRTRECHHLPGEQERDEQYTIELMNKWGIQ